MILEKKVFEFKLDDIDSQGTIRGFASTFGNEDLGSDIVEKGAFKKSIKESKGGVWPILADHDPRSQVGWNVRAQETDKGLMVEGQLDLNVQLARERYSLAKKAMELGARAGLSIGYQTIKADPDRDNPRIRRIKEVKMWEYSLVTFPMNTEAFLTGVKSTHSDELTLLFQELRTKGYSESDLLKALHGEAAGPVSDPNQLVQSANELLIRILKSS